MGKRMFVFLGLPGVLLAAFLAAYAGSILAARAAPRTGEPPHPWGAPRAPAADARLPDAGVRRRRLDPRDGLGFLVRDRRSSDADTFFEPPPATWPSPALIAVGGRACSPRRSRSVHPGPPIARAARSARSAGRWRVAPVPAWRRLAARPRPAGGGRDRRGRRRAHRRLRRSGRRRCSSRRIVSLPSRLLLAPLSPGSAACCSAVRRPRGDRVAAPGARSASLRPGGPGHPDAAA